MVPPSQPGPRKCIQCNRIFLSADRDTIRRCDECKKGDKELSVRDLGRHSHIADPREE